MAGPNTGNEVVDALIFAAHRVRTAADSALRECGLSFPGYKLLRALENSDRPMREISAELHIAARTVTDIADGLEARGLVSRQASPADRRVTLLHLTGPGRDQLAAAAARAEATAAAAVAGLSAAEQQTLRRLLGQVGTPA
jgi:DNA-binding MarR family transcriptional regulator